MRRCTHMTVVLMLAAVLQCQAAPVERVPSTLETLERLHKLAPAPRRSRPVPMMPEEERPTTSEKETDGQPTTLTPPTVKPENFVEPVESTSDDKHSFVLVPVTDQTTINQFKDQLNNGNLFNYPNTRTSGFAPSVPGNNGNLLKYPNMPASAFASLVPGNNEAYIDFLRNRGIIDRVTNFAGNFFPIEIDVPDLVGSLTSWIPGASLIGQILTGNRPNTQRYAVLKDNGQVIVVNFLKTLPSSEDSFNNRPFQNPFQPFRRVQQSNPNPGFLFNNPFPQFTPQMIPQDIILRHQSVPNLPLPLEYPGSQFHNSRQEFLESLPNFMQPNFFRQDGNKFHSFGNGPDIARLQPNMNGHFRIPELDALLFPRGRSLDTSY